MRSFILGIASIAAVAAATQAEMLDLERERSIACRQLIDQVLQGTDELFPGGVVRTQLKLDIESHVTGSHINLGAFQDQSQESAPDSGDKTGTNPIAFTNDFRVYNEYRWLNTAGDGDQNVTTVEFRTPLFDGNWQFRVRAYRNDIDADVNGDGITDINESGFGDMDLRFLTVPIVDMANKFAFAVGLEAFLDTASDDALGSDATVLGPQVFAVFFKPFDSPHIDLIAPAYQHRFSVDGEDVNQSLIDIFILKTGADKSWWALLDPQIVFDHENDLDFMLLDIEFGMMMGPPGHSIYVRPSIGFTNDRPYDSSIEFGYKIIW